MDFIKISELKPHPRNEEFFDPISGVKWKEFLKSVKERGVIEPVVITPDKVIVSGHHRVRACKELGIGEIKCEVRIYDNEDDIVRDLIETNIRQRGDVGGSEMKMAARIKELERIYGIKEGRPKKLDDNHLVSKTQEDLAAEMGLDLDTYKRYKRLADAIPELAAAVDGGKVTKTTAIAMMRKLSQDEQKELLEEFDTLERITGSDVEKFIQENERLKQENNELKNREPEVKEVEVEVIKEVVPDDYEELKEALEISREEVKEANERAEKSDKHYLKLYKDFKVLDDELKRRNGTAEQIKNARNTFQSLVAGTNNYLNVYGGCVWAFAEYESMDEYQKKDIIKVVKALNGFAQQLFNNLGGNIA